MTTDGSTPNVDLLRQTMDEILANPDQHKQDYWATQTDCGTAYCFAGWACVISGETVAFEKDRPMSRWTVSQHHIGELAADLLGVDGETCSELFDYRNTTADLKHYVDQIAEHGRIVAPVERMDEVPFR